MKKLLTFLFAIMALFACSEGGPDDIGRGNSNNDQPKVPEITLDATEVNFTTEGDSTIVTFTSSEDWTAEAINNRADGWCSISPTNGSAGNAKITITATANDTPDDRTATVVIKSGTTKKTIAVSQKQKDAITVTASKFEVSADGGEIEIEVKANIDFNVEIDESAKSWVTHRSTRAMKTSTLIMEVAENDDAEKRKANITITSGNLMEKITIYQEVAKPTIVLSQNEYIVPSAGETIAVEVKSNVDVTVEMPSDADWVSENTTRATSTNTYYFDIASNDEYDARKTEIKFINKDNNLSETITITQTQKDAIVIAEDNYSVKCEGGEINIEVGHNLEFDITIDGEWITQQQTRALETTKLTFVVAENVTDKVREGSITFTSKDGAISQKIYVTQDVPVSEITYTSSDGKIVTPYSAGAFGASIVSNVYENGKGVITFDGNITRIGYNAFLGCERLTGITIPDSVTSIGDSAFRECSRLVNVTIGNSVTSIGDSAFSDCVGLQNITIPDSVTSIGESAFHNCCSLESVTIGNSVTSIGDSAFELCSSLQNITIPDSVTSIGDSAFANCSSLVNVTIGNNVTSIGDYAFYGCSRLASITIPDSVTEIEEGAFSCCSRLVNVTIGNSVTSIGGGAFFDCVGLQNITIPDSVTSIGWEVFRNCYSLESVTIGNSVTSIGGSAFDGCSSLQNITIPDSVTSIGDSAFNECYSLASVYCKSTIPPVLKGLNVFNRNADVRKIYVPAASVDAYKNAAIWKNYADEIFADTSKN